MELLSNVDQSLTHFLFSFTSKDPKKRGLTDYCSSKSGRVGGAQAVTLGNSCLTTGTEEEIVGRIQHEILHAVGSLHEMNRPDRDSHITISIKSQYSSLLSPKDLKLWNLGDSNHNNSELSTLTTNYDVNSLMQYSSDFGFRTFNDFYNEVGFGNTFDLTATDKVVLNLLYSCPDIKRNIFNDFLHEETIRTYIELTYLNITPDEKSKR